ncbi:hypothetical protein AZI86_05845 [Bdellovibrio bacteriovorus]|uniref:Uncharacterized protein n=1 Tax=Bdellovibrio bacteriovorus TaxID=959 RepID=A0A150WQC2_BDEBC|nr:hypothetical protein [Bdellovibrio bacteriovorus]KYG66566.1 hypothetical protein AZI86_05845 [Bdellovibrio bacteriovorus]
MNKISDTSNPTAVKIFINTLTVMIFMTAPLLSQAQTAPTGSTTTMFGGDSVEVTNIKRCDNIATQLSRAEEKISTACRKAGMGGGKECVSKVKDCDEVTGEESFNTMGAFTQAVGAYTGNSQISAIGNGDTNSSCPQMSGKDYFEEKSSIEKDLKTAEKELADLDKEKAEAQKEYDDALKEINDNLAKAQEEAKEKAHEIDEETQKQVAEFQTAQAQAAKDMRAKKTDILTLQGQLINLDRQKATALIDLTNYTAESDCKKKMYEAYATYKKAVSSGTSSGHITRAKEKKNELIMVYTKCMEGFSQKRMAVNENYKQQRDKLEKQITDSNADVAAIEDGLKQSQEALDKMKSTAETKKAEALQSVISLGTRAQQEMEAAYKNLQAKSSGIGKKETALNKQLNQLNNNLMTLGPAPKRGTDYAPSDAMSDIEAGMGEINDINAMAASCPQYIKDAAAAKLKKYGGSSKSQKGDR